MTGGPPKPAGKTHTPPSYPWYHTDWNQSTTRLRLNLAERGLFREVIDRLFSDGTVPDDVEVISRMAAADVRAVRRAWPAVRACLRVAADGRLHHPKMDEIRQKLARHRQQQQANAERRWEAARRRREARDADDQGGTAGRHGVGIDTAAGRDDDRIRTAAGRGRVEIGGPAARRRAQVA